MPLPGTPPVPPPGTPPQCPMLKAPCWHPTAPPVETLLIPPAGAYTHSQCCPPYSPSCLELTPQHLLLGPPHTPSTFQHPLLGRTPPATAPHCTPCWEPPTHT
ncbi:emerin-like [Platysternon megacephalum]|uniref:Emerin-like n=1 Tax=Platysternon megacephalum TaxID=55544 RepID=A0A4D9DJ16_9SAUR|nr:emerin-like [Platysternon megacephalum]